MKKVFIVILAVLSLATSVFFYNSTSVYHCQVLQCNDGIATILHPCGEVFDVYATGKFSALKECQESCFRFLEVSKNPEKWIVLSMDLCK